MSQNAGELMSWSPSMSAPLIYGLCDCFFCLPAYFLKHYNIFLLGCSCIHLAAQFGHTAIVAYLLAKGQDVDMQDRNGMTALMWSSYRVFGYVESEIHFHFFMLSEPATYLLITLFLTFSYMLYMRNRKNETICWPQICINLPQNLY